MAALTVIGLASLLVTLSLNMIAGWDLDTAGACPGTPEFCSGSYWQAAVEYLPVWLFLGQILVVIAMASPVALVRTRR